MAMYRELDYPVLELRKEKRIFVKIEGEKVDFFLIRGLFSGS